MTLSDQSVGFSHYKGETIEIGMCAQCGAWLPWATIEALGGLEHRHNAQFSSFIKRAATVEGTLR